MTLIIWNFFACLINLSKDYISNKISRKYYKKNIQTGEDPVLG